MRSAGFVTEPITGPRAAGLAAPAGEGGAARAGCMGSARARAKAQAADAPRGRTRREVIQASLPSSRLRSTGKQV